MPTEYPWYVLVDAHEPLEQGDFIKSCPVFIPDYTVNPYNDTSLTPDDEPEITGSWETNDVIVLSQSCDLADGRLQHMVVCPYWARSEMLARGMPQNNIAMIRKGQMPAYHMLNVCHIPEHSSGLLIVDFGATFTVPYEFMKSFVAARGSRLRLLSPYKEHLSQAFARFFMRVGLPINIDDTELKRK